MKSETGIINMCVLAAVIGCICDELGEKLAEVLEPILSDGHEQLCRLALTYTLPNQPGREQIAQDAVSEMVLGVLERSRVGGCDPQRQTQAKAYFCQWIRHNVYYAGRCERTDRRRPLDEAEGLAQSDDATSAEPKPDDHAAVEVARRVFLSLPPEKRAIIVRIYPFLSDDENGVPATLDPSPPKPPAYAVSRVHKAFLFEVQDEIGLPRIMPSESKRRARLRLELVKRRRPKPT